MFKRFCHFPVPWYRRLQPGLTCGALVLVLLGASPSDGTIPLDQWTYKLVSDQHHATMGLGFGDIDRDGLVDIVSGRYWYRNPGGDMLDTWVQNSFPSGMRAFRVTDVDGDSLTDVMAQMTSGDLNVYWLEAIDAGATAWTEVFVGSMARVSHSEGAQGYRIGQIESGGKPEVAITSGDGIYYFNIPAAPEQGNWPRVHVNAAPSDEGFALGDIDRDGHMDIIATTGHLKGVVWYRNPGDGSANWAGTQLARFVEANYPDRTEVADLNGDGRLDVIVTEENQMGSEASTIWWEQPLDAFSNAWPAHPIVVQGSTNSMDVADLDQDGDTDVILAEHRGTLKLAIWSNDGAGGLTEHMVSSGIESHLGARTVDLDGDGDLDIVSIAWDAYQNVHLWRNDGGSASAVDLDNQVTSARFITNMAAWPNPFNPILELRAEMLQAATLHVRVFDATGRLVRDLHRGVAEAGVLRMAWDGTDDAGGRVAAGIYLVRAEAGGDVLNTKVSLVK